MTLRIADYAGHAPAAGELELDAPGWELVQEAIEKLYAIADWAEELGDGEMAELALLSIVKLRRASRGSRTGEARLQ